MMKTIMKNLGFISLMVFIASLSGLAQEKIYISPDLIDMDAIREEEGLSEESEIERSYIFLAVKNGENYEIYATRGSSDFDEDEEKAWDEPNDLNEYVNVTRITRNFDIQGDSYMCYISALPYYERLFKKENLKDPFDDGDIMEIPTSVSIENKNLLKGSKTLPILKTDGTNLGIEHYIAFYNIQKVEKEDKDGNKTEVIEVTSYGLIKIRILDP